jgi:DNA topoisomerase-3
MEDDAILRGFQELKPGSEYDALYEAALCRERADWIVGINATRLFSSLYGQTLNVGRVMTPTLALVVERETAIKGFVPEDFYTVVLDCDGIELISDRIAEKEKAEGLHATCSSDTAVRITKVEVKDKREKAPALFDLTTLQREANRRYGYTAQQTLDYTQSLYEKKLVSYPRTDSRYLTDDMEETLPGLLGKVEELFAVNTSEERNLSAVINGKKVTDHHAIIPTQSVSADEVAKLPTGEREIIRLVATRLAEAVSSPCIYAETIVEGECAGETFKAKGKQVIDNGWKAIAPSKEEKAAPTDTATISRELKEGETISVLATKIKTGKTSPPRSFTEDSLLALMEKAGAKDTPDDAERKGLGTPATRAGIIEKLVRVGFIERRGDKKTKYLVPTHKGEALITVVPEQIQSASMTAEWEQKLVEIERGRYEPQTFMDEIGDMISTLVETYEVIPDAKVLMHPAYEVIGKCPCCGNDVVERQKGFTCSNKDCKFALWKDNRFFDALSKKMTKGIAGQLLKNGRANLKKCCSAKTGRTYDATVVLTTNDAGQAQFGLEFDKRKGD